MSGRVVFYQLNGKFLQKERVPAEAEQVLYYSLAVGHHVGVIDTFKPIVTCNCDSYFNAVAALPEGEARRKLDGLRRFGEVSIDKSHTAALLEAFAAAAARLDDEARTWTDRLVQALLAIEREPAITLMVRRQP